MRSVVLAILIVANSVFFPCAGAGFFNGSAARPSHVPFVDVRQNPRQFGCDPRLVEQAAVVVDQIASSYPDLKVRVSPGLVGRFNEGTLDVASGLLAPSHGPLSFFREAILAVEMAHASDRAARYFSGSWTARNRIVDESVAYVSAFVGFFGFLAGPFFVPAPRRSDELMGAASLDYLFGAAENQRQRFWRLTAAALRHAPSASPGETASIVLDVADLPTGHALETFLSQAVGTAQGLDAGLARFFGPSRKSVRLTVVNSSVGRTVDEARVAGAFRKIEALKIDRADRAPFEGWPIPVYNPVHLGITLAIYSRYSNPAVLVDKVCAILGATYKQPADPRNWKDALAVMAAAIIA